MKYSRVHKGQFQSLMFSNFKGPQSVQSSSRETQGDKISRISVYWVCDKN
jgi:hypothetical protein